MAEPSTPAPTEVNEATTDLYNSIPKEILSTVNGWKVKNGVVLRSSKIQSTSRMHRFKVTNLVSSLFVYWCDQNSGKLIFHVAIRRIKQSA